MADLSFSYASSYEAYIKYLDFLENAGWSIIFRRIGTSFSEPAICIMEGGQDKKWEHPPIIGLHWAPPITSKIIVQGYRTAGALPQGEGDFFGSYQQASFESVVATVGSWWDKYPAPGYFAQSDKLYITPPPGSWDPATTTYAFLYQPAPGNQYTMRATGNFPDTAPLTIAGAGIAIRNTTNKFVRVFLYSNAGAPRIAFDSYDDVAYTLHNDIAPAGYSVGSSISFYLEQLGGVVLAFYKTNLGWNPLGIIELDERVMFDGNEECGIFSYTNNPPLWVTEWTEFRWPSYQFGLGEPLFFGGVYDVDPQGIGTAWAEAEEAHTGLLLDPGVGTPELLHAGSFQDHTEARTFDSKITIVKPWESKCGLYTQVSDNANLREGVFLERASAALGRAWTNSNTAVNIDEQPQARTGDLVLHPFFVGIQFTGKQLSGETEGLYEVDASVSAPNNYDLIRLRGEFYLYFDGIAFGPVTDPGGVPIFGGVGLTWVSPDKVEEEEQYLPRNFRVYEGAEQPQLVVEWEEPPFGWGSSTEMRVRRKLIEYPLDVSDGDLVYAGNGLEEGFSDRNVDLNLFYYYKAFIFKDGVGWLSGPSLQGVAFSWQSGFGERKIYENLPEPFRVYDLLQRWIMVFATRSPEALNFQEDKEEKGFLRRVIKNFGLEVDRIKGFHAAFDTVFDPMNIRLDWLKYLGSRYDFVPYEANSGKRQKWAFQFWPYWLKKKGTELLMQVVIEQTLHVTPGFVYGKRNAAMASDLSGTAVDQYQHTWYPGVLDANVEFIDYFTDPNCYTHGHRCTYNFTGIRIYVYGTFSSDLLAEVKAKLSPYTPLTSVIRFYVDEEFVFELKAENGDGSTDW